MHQFGSMVLAADSYRRDLLADAVRVRPIPTSQDAKDADVASFARSAYAIGTMLIRVGKHLQGMHSTGQNGGWSEDSRLAGQDLLGRVFKRATRAGWQRG